MASDLASKIRTRAEDWVENCLDPQAAAKAVLAVLDIHKPDVQDGSVNSDGKCCMCPGYGDPVSVHERAYPNGDVLLMHGHMDADNPVCAECGNAYEGEHVAYPCPTVLAVAAALGIEVSSD